MGSEDTQPFDGIGIALSAGPFDSSLSAKRAVPNGPPGYNLFSKPKV